MERQNSSASLKSLSLDSSRDQAEFLDTCCSDSDVFDPPAWRPGRFLQFADILTVEDEPSVRPVSLPTERLGHHHHHHHWSSVGGEGFVSDSTSESGSLLLQMVSEPLSVSVLHQCRPSLSTSLSVSRRTALVLTSSMAVALTALTLLSFVLF
ncbi:hypothetical protein ACOMHN_045198 [Nucella lapillus]